MVDIEYANAYSEILELLNYVSQEDYDKIPKERIELFESNHNKDYKFSYDITKTLDEQNVSKKAKTIIAILFRDYWATDVQREKILAKEKYDRQMKEREIKEKYNSDNLFKNHMRKEKTEIKKVSMREYKESILKKMINKIKSIFYMN